MHLRVPSRTSGNAALMPRQVRLQDYVGILRRRLLTILVVFLATTASTVVFVLRKPDVYQSFSTLVIEEPPTAASLVFGESRRPIGFYRGILSSRSFLEEVLDSAGIEAFREVLREGQTDTLAMLYYIRDHLSLGSTSFQSLLQFTARAGSKNLAFLLAKHGTTVFKKKCGEVEAEQSRETLRQIEKQIAIIREKMEKAEKEYQAFRDRTGLVGEGVTTELMHLQDVYYKERAELTLKQAEYEATKSQLEVLESKITPKTKSETQEVAKLRKKLRELEKEKRNLLSLNLTISPSSPLQREINTVEQKLLRAKGQEGLKEIANPKLISQWQALRNQVASQELAIEFSKKRLKSYRRSIEAYKTQHPEILEQTFELSRLERARTKYEETYNALLGKAEEAKIMQAAETGGIKIIDPAYKPQKPIPKNEGRFYLAGTLMGLLLGLGIAFFLEFNDTTIKSSEDIERFLGIPVIGTIPHIVIPKNESIDIRRTVSRSQHREQIVQYPRNLVNFSSDESIASEAYRSLRTNLFYASPDKPLRTILTTSSGPGEGKSLTVTNVALAYAQMGSKVVLVDTDLRRPVIHHLFQVRREPGFCDLFLKDTNWDQVIKSTKIPNLSLITAGRFTPSPAELIGAQKMNTVLEQLKERFDMVFFDTPPLVAVTDATLLGKKTDGVVLVIKSRKTERELAKRAIGILTSVGVKVLGSVLNDIDLSHRYSSYGYYKYYYHYYRSKKD